MQLPDRIPGMKWLTVLWAICLVLWVVIESGLWATVFAAVLTVVLLLGQLFNRFLGGRTISTGEWLLLSAVLGVFVGLSSGLMTLILMAVKTGLHAHGPEFSTAELNWVLAQIPLWTLAGLLVGFGLGLLLKARHSQYD